MVAFDHFCIRVLPAFDGDSNISVGHFRRDISSFRLAFIKISEHGLIAVNGVNRNAIKLFVSDWTIDNHIGKGIIIFDIVYHRGKLGINSMQAIFVLWR